MDEQKLNYYQLNVIKRRKFLLYFGTVAAGGSVGLKLWETQVLDQENYKALSQDNRIRITLIAAPRGSIYDAYGVVLATNEPTYDLLVNLEDVKNITLLQNKLSYVLNIPLKQVEQMFKRRQKSAKYLPLSLKSNISYEQMAMFATFAEEFPGILVENSLIRQYPLGEKASHLLGFVNWTSIDVLESVPKEQVASFQKSGQTGIESAYNGLLTGKDGGIQNEVNSVGLPVRELNKIPPQPGVDISLSIISSLQSYIYDNMEHNGAVIVSAPRTGEILSIVSKPGFNPDVFFDGVEVDQWQSMLNDENKILNDRCIRGTFSPGSTFKILVALAGLNEQLVDESTTFFCPGYFRQGRQVYACWKRDGHGAMDVVQAIEHSCNVYFYQLGKKLGINLINRYAQIFRFGQKIDSMFPNELSGILPSPAWKKSRFNQIWLPGDTINMSIGQGYLTVTPLQMLYYLNMVLNNGAVVPFKILQKIAGQPVTETIQEQSPAQAQINYQAYELVKKGMHLCVNSELGTGRSAQSNKIPIGGKTGTTQVVSLRTKRKILKRDKVIDDKFKNHGWFIGYTPSIGNPAISIAVLLENAGTGAVAANFGKQVLEFANEVMIQNRPVLPNIQTSQK